METKETIDYAIGKLGEMGEQLNPYAKQGWDILVRQQYIQAIIAWSFLLLAIGASWFMLPKLWRNLTKADGDPDILVPQGTLLFIILGGLAVAFVYGILAVGQVINPEYYVIKELLPK